MTMLTSTIAWCTLCVERARRAHSFTLDAVSHLIGSRSESCHFSSIVIHERTSLSRFSSSSSTCPSCLLFLLPPALRAVPWARQPDRHGKPVLLRQQGEWGRLRRLHFPLRTSSSSVNRQERLAIELAIVKAKAVSGETDLRWIDARYQIAVCLTKHSSRKSEAVLQKNLQEAQWRITAEEDMLDKCTRARDS